MQLAMETVVKMRILIVGKEAQYNAEYFYKKAFLELGNVLYHISFVPIS